MSQTHSHKHCVTIVNCVWSLRQRLDENQMNKTIDADKSLHMFTSIIKLASSAQNVHILEPYGDSYTND